MSKAIPRLMSHTLIITEKPQAALKIASALAEGKIESHEENKVPYYTIKRNKSALVVCCAIGHLYTVTEKEKKWSYPAFDLKWGETQKETNRFLGVIKKLATNADSFIVACDYDIEGEVIGLNVLRFACNQKDARRMKFSTLTQEELIESYEHVLPTIDWGQANAGEARHFLDYLWGINLSRALINAIRSTGRFQILSIGRVQGPALKIIVDREKLIRAFVPEKFWQIELPEFVAWHKQERFDKESAERIAKKIKNKVGIVKNVIKKILDVEPPAPFDLTSLQLEAYKHLGLSPKQTMVLAQALYIGSYISYPRTSSQKLPASIGYNKILDKLSKNKKYTLLIKDLIEGKRDLKPHEGKKSDPAHPAVYPTGETPKDIDKKGLQLYDLIVRRFLATFSVDAKRESITNELDICGELFVNNGIKTIFDGWFKFYRPKLEEREAIKLVAGQKIKVKDVKVHEKETKPERRFTQASIVKELDKKNLGTKSTRADIIENLYKRFYVKDTSIEATELGIKTIETLNKYCPLILDEKLTRHFELDMEKIRKKKKKVETVLAEAKKVLEKMLTDFKKNEKDIGEELAKANLQTMDIMNTLSACSCKKGNLKIKYSRKTKRYFVACSNYPECRVIYSLPPGSAKAIGQTCKCGFPIVLVLRAGKRPWRFCINPECPDRIKYLNAKKERA